MGCRGGGSAERGTESRKGLFSNIWLWRAVTAVLTAVVILISCIQFVNPPPARDVPVCPSLEVCPPGWLYFQRKCYYLSENEANWNSSQSHCSLHNASLLVLENHQELSFMMKITKQDPWIGLYKRNEEFFWVNGKALDNELCGRSPSLLLQGHGQCGNSFASCLPPPLNHGALVCSEEGRNERCFPAAAGTLELFRRMWKSKLVPVLIARHPEEGIEVKGSGNCAYLESQGVSASGCYLTRKWVCSLNINSA